MIAVSALPAVAIAIAGALSPARHAILAWSVVAIAAVTVLGLLRHTAEHAPRRRRLPVIVAGIAVEVGLVAATPVIYAGSL